MIKIARNTIAIFVCLSCASFASIDSISAQTKSTNDIPTGITQKDLPYSLRNATDPTAFIFDPINKTFMEYRISDTSSLDLRRCRNTELETQNTFLCSRRVLKFSKENVDQIYATNDLNTFYKIDPSELDNPSILKKYAGGQIRWNNPIINRYKFLDVAGLSLCTFSALWIVNHFQHTTIKALPSLMQFSAVMIIELPFVLRKRSYFMTIIPEMNNSTDSTKSGFANENPR